MNRSPPRIATRGRVCRYCALTALVICLTGGKATASATFVVNSLVLYQPNQILVERLGDDVAPLASYLKEIEDREAVMFANSSPHRGISGALVIAVKPGRQSRAWLVLGSNRLPAALASQAKAEAEAEAVTPISVKLGPIAVAILFDAWGGGRPVTDLAHPAPLPEEWRGASAPELVPDGPLSRVWP